MGSRRRTEIPRRSWKLPGLKFFKVLDIFKNRLLVFVSFASYHSTICIKYQKNIIENKMWGGGHGNASYLLGLTFKWWDQIELVWNITFFCFQAIPCTASYSIHFWDFRIRRWRLEILTNTKIKKKSLTKISIGLTSRILLFKVKFCQLSSKDNKMMDK